MTIPNYYHIMLPFLRFLADGKEHTIGEITEHISEEFGLSNDERRQLLSCGARRFDNRVGWARTCLGKAGLVEGTKRGYCRITERGLQVLHDNPPEINKKYLERFPEFVKFVAPEKKDSEAGGLIAGTLVPVVTPPRHNEIRDMILEIGKIEGKISEVEYPIDGLRLDVAWKTIASGNPKWAFEVQMGGNFYEALTKLKHAWDKWNSKPFLVTTDKYASQAKSLLEGSFHEMRDDARIVDWEKIIALHKLLKESHKIKSEIRL
jgi:hypothetical protein